MAVRGGLRHRPFTKRELEICRRHYRCIIRGLVRRGACPVLLQNHIQQVSAEFVIRIMEGDSAFAGMDLDERLHEGFRILSKLIGGVDSVYSKMIEATALYAWVILSQEYDEIMEGA